MQILTPAFHFKILDDFIDVFNEQSAVLARKLAVELGTEAFNIFPYVTLCTLDIVCGECQCYIYVIAYIYIYIISNNWLVIASQKLPWVGKYMHKATASRNM